VLYYRSQIAGLLVDAKVWRLGAGAFVENGVNVPRRRCGCRASRQQSSTKARKLDGKIAHGHFGFFAESMSLPSMPVACGRAIFVFFD